MNNCYFCGDVIDQKLVLCMADDLSHAICRKAGKAVPKEERDADAARIAKLGSLPWAAYRTRSGEWSSSFYFGATRNVVLVGCDTPYGIPPEAIAYEVPEGKEAEQVAKESGGIIVVVFDDHPRGPIWNAFADLPSIYRNAKLPDCEPREVRKTSRQGITYHALVRWPEETSRPVPASPLAEMKKMANVSQFPPHTWWWHNEPDGRCVLWPLMTFQKLDASPVTDASLFRCVHCKVEGTGKALQSMPCSSPEWYHGDIRFYRQYFTPMRCLGKDGLDGLPCCNVWIRSLSDDGFMGPRCPACGSSETEEIPSDKE